MKIKSAKAIMGTLEHQRRHLDLARQRVLLESNQALRAMRTCEHRMRRTKDPAERLRIFGERLTYRIHLSDLLQQAQDLEDQGWQWISRAKTLRALLNERNMSHA